MKGRIKIYNDQKGFGFILGEDGEDRFFHITSVKSVEQPEHGAIVDFREEKSEKGLTAVDILIQVKKESPVFISFGEVRLKLNNIKNYGISSEKRYFEKIRKVVKEYWFKNPDFAYTGELQELEGAEEGDYDENDNDIVVKKIKYLYITTYQNDNYKFYQDKVEFNVTKKCEELDKWLT